MEFKCCTKSTVQEKEVSRLYEFLRVIADKNRLKILCVLKKGSMCVCDIFPAVGISQKLASHHLRQMRRIDLVCEERKGNFIHYSINKEVLNEYKLFFNKLTK